MADLSNLKAEIAAKIKANGVQGITGPILQQTLLDIVDALNDSKLDTAVFEKALDDLKREEYRKHYLTFEAAADNVEIYFACPEDNENVFVTIEVSTDGGQTWMQKTSSFAESTGEGTLLATLNKGETLLVRGNGPTGYYSEEMDDAVGNYFFAGGNAYVYGNVMSLLGGANFAGLDTIEDENAFAYLFADYNESGYNESLLSHPDKPLVLPATTLADYCYSGMFYGCTGLTAAPALPATTLAESCYNGMFSGCTGLTAAPALPATTLADYCYQSMFQNCTGLVAITCLATDISASGALFYWVSNVAASGTFTKAAGVEWPEGVSGIPSGWEVVEV